jgi:hypothetical protein
MSHTTTLSANGPSASSKPTPLNQLEEAMEGPESGSEVTDSAEIKLTTLDKIKMAIITPISIYCLIYIVDGIVSSGAKSMGVSPVVGILLFFFVVWLLGMLEGLQIALLEIEAAKLESVRYFVPGVYAAHKLTLGEGMRKWLGGRQVFVILSVFLLAQMTTFSGMTDFPFTTTPMPKWFQILFVETGLPGALIVVAIGQLVPQLIATTHPLFVMRAPGTQAVVYIAMLLQRLGVTHFAWAVTHCFRWRIMHREERIMNSGDTSATEKALRLRVNGGEHAKPDLGIFELIKYAVMTAASLFSLFIIIAGVSAGESRFPAHPAVNFVLMIVSILLLGYLEGLQVALLRFDTCMRNASPEEILMLKEKMPRVYKGWRQTEGRKMESYLCGRQVFVIMSVFMVAQVTAFPNMTSLPGIGELPPWFMSAVFETGLPGALIVVACGQLIPQLIGEEYPLALMDLWGAPQVTTLALVLHSIGLTHFAVLVSLITKHAFGLTGSSERYSYQMHFSEAKRLEMLQYAKTLLNDTNGDRILSESIRSVADGATLDNQTWTDLASLVNKQSHSQGEDDNDNNAPVNGTRPRSTTVDARKLLDEEMANLVIGANKVDKSAFEVSGNSESDGDFPTAEQLAQHCLETNNALPRFLLPPDADGHIPPHIVAYELMRQLGTACWDA